MVFQRMTMSTVYNRIPKLFREGEACFLFLTKGAFEFRTPTNYLAFQQGEGLLAKCGNYYIENPRFKQCDETFTFIGAYFYPELIKGFFQSDITINTFQKSFDATKVSMEPMLNTFLESLNFLFDNPIVIDDNIIITKLKELLILLSKSERAESIHAFIDSLFNPYQYEFEQIINQNLYSNLSLIEYSHLCNCSVSTFKRKFNSHYKTSPAKYFLSKKIEKSTELLATSQNPIGDIAYACGFENISSFNKIFKKKYDLTPSQYRLSQMDK